MTQNFDDLFVNYYSDRLIANRDFMSNSYAFQLLHII